MLVVVRTLDRLSVAKEMSVLQVVKLMDGKSPLEIQLPGPLNALKKPLIRLVKGTVVEKVLRDHNVLKDGMLE